MHSDDKRRGQGGKEKHSKVQNPERHVRHIKEGRDASSKSRSTRGHTHGHPVKSRHRAKDTKSTPRTYGSPSYSSHGESSCPRGEYSYHGSCYQVCQSIADCARGETCRKVRKRHICLPNSMPVEGTEMVNSLPEDTDTHSMWSSLLFLVGAFVVAHIFLRCWRYFVRWVLSRTQGSEPTADSVQEDAVNPPIEEIAEMERQLSIPRASDWDDARRPTPEEYERLTASPLVVPDKQPAFMVDSPASDSSEGSPPALEQPSPQRKPYWLDPMAPPPIKVHTTPDPYIDDVPGTPLEKREFASPVFMGAALHPPEKDTLDYSSDPDIDTQKAWGSS